VLSYGEDDVCLRPARIYSSAALLCHGICRLPDRAAYVMPSRYEFTACITGRAKRQVLYRPLYVQVPYRSLKRGDKTEKEFHI